MSAETHKPIQLGCETVDGKLRIERRGIVYRFDPDAVIYPLHGGSFTITDEEVYANKLPKGTKIRGLNGFMLRDPATGFYIRHTEDILTLRRGTLFGAYSHSAHPVQIQIEPKGGIEPPT